jgi:predicted DNA-binding transcriptional regulator AlpA
VLQSGTRHDSIDGHIITRPSFPAGLDLRITDIHGEPLGSPAGAVAGIESVSRTPEPSRPPATPTSDEERVLHSGWPDDKLISIQEIRTLFGLGRTAAYELTHRSDFPEAVIISPRCYRWWASEVTAFAVNLRRQGTALRRFANASRAGTRQRPHVGTSPGRISGNVRLAHTSRKAS